MCPFCKGTVVDTLANVVTTTTYGPPSASIRVDARSRRPRGIDKDTTTIIEGAGHATALAGCVKQLRAQVGDSTSDYEFEKLQERLAKLVGGWRSSRSARRPRPR